MPGECYAPVESALARLAFSCWLLVGAYGAASGYAANSSFIIGLRPRGCWLVLLRSACDARRVTAKTQREAQLNPSETDLPRFCEARWV